MACRRSGRRDLARAVKRAGAILEGADDARHGLAEDDADDLAKDGVAELEIDEEIDEDLSEDLVEDEDLEIGDSLDEDEEPEDNGDSE